MEGVYSVSYPKLASGCWGEEVEYSPVRLQMPVSILTCAVIEAMVDMPVRSTLPAPPLLTCILTPHLC